MSQIRDDLRYAIRTLIGTPGFTVIAITVLGIGIGANATVFSLANALFFRPLPVADASRVVRVYSNRYSNTAYRTYFELRDRNSTLSGLAAFDFRSVAVRLAGETEQQFGTMVTGNYFPLLRLRPAQGRLLIPSDDVDGAPPVVVLSHAYWTNRFGASPAAIGSTTTLNGQPFTIVGVAPERFTGLMTPLVGSVWIPLAADAVLRPALDPVSRTAATSLHMVGRLKPGINIDRAQADLDTIGRQVRGADAPSGRSPAITVYAATTLHPEIAAPVTAFAAVLMTLVAVVLLIVCVNLANLVLARAAGREGELAVRQALGAGRARLVRQLLTESALLSVGGAVAGLAIAFWWVRFLTSVSLPTPVPVALDMPLDVRVLLFTAAIAVVATLAFGVMPAFTASAVDLVAALKGAGADGARHGRLRSAFLIGQVALSVVLLTSAGLFLRSFQHAQSIDTGFDARGVVTASIDLDSRGYTSARGAAFIAALTERLGREPGVAAANVVDIVPLTLSNTTTYQLREGDVEPALGEALVTPLIYVNRVGPGHFDTLRIALIDGRDFRDADTATSGGVAIVNETLAKTFWPGKRAVGQHLRELGGPQGAGPTEVIGVVRDSKYVTVGEAARPFLYRPLAQAYTPRLTMLVRSAGPAAEAVRAIREAVRELDPALAVFNVAPLTDVIAISLLPVRMAGNLLGALGALALVLAALGVYGVLSYLVRSRTREIGIRMAIGASPRSVVALVVRQAMAWTLYGAAIGTALAVAAGQLLRSFLYGISPTDGLTFGGVVLVLAAVACAAAILPALRASRVSPIVALRAL